jgi:hypothetical protein
MDAKTGIEVAREMGIAHPETEALRDLERGSMGGALAGAGSLVLGILGLIGLLPQVLDSIAVIAAGVALLIGGAAIVARYSNLAGLPQSRKVGAGGMEVVAFAGVAGVALGILALLGVAAETLLSIAPIALGAALIVESSALTRLDAAISKVSSKSDIEVVNVASGSDIVVGIGGMVLGILALSGVDPLTLSLIAMLSIGAAITFSGSSLAGRLFALFG